MHNFGPVISGSLLVRGLFGGVMVALTRSNEEATVHVQSHLHLHRNELMVRFLPDLTNNTDEDGTSEVGDLLTARCIDDKFPYHLKVIIIYSNL